MNGVADHKLKTRRLIHARAAVSCVYKDEVHPAGLVFDDGYTGGGLTVRYHNKMSRGGDLDGDYADVIDGIDRLVFSDENVAEVSAALVANGQPALVLRRGAVVTIPAYKGLMFTLDTAEPPDGPLEAAWVVARTKG